MTRERSLEPAEEARSPAGFEGFIDKKARMDELTVA